MNPKIYLIVAADIKGGIGLGNKLAWDLPGDMKFFQKTTIHTENIQFRNMVIMGRKTWETIPEAHRPLKGRKNVVITKNKDYKVPKGVVLAHSLEEAMKSTDERVADIFIIGGASIYELVFKKSRIDGIYLTKVKKEFKCDRFFPKIPRAFAPERLGEGEDNGVRYEFFYYKKKKITRPARSTKATKRSKRRR